jgi:polyisoprenoid-binding protein YceI
MIPKLCAAVSVVVASAALSPPLLYDIPPFHSQIEFSVPFMGLARVKGGFEDFAGALMLDSANLERSSVTVVIQSASLHTGNERRDTHLKSSDFIAVDSYPEITFRSVGARAKSTGSYELEGDLTLHGVTRRITVPFTLRHAVTPDSSGIDYVGFDANFKLNWRDFGIAASNTNNSWFQPATMLVGDSMSVSLSIEAERRHASKVHYPRLEIVRRAIVREGLERYTTRFRRLAAERPDSAQALGRLLLDMGRGFIETNRTADAVRVLRAVVETDSTNIDAHVALGEAYLASGDSARASQMLRRAAHASGTNPHALELLGRLH